AAGGVGEVDGGAGRADEGEDTVGRRTAAGPGEELGDALEGPDVVGLLDDVLAVERPQRGVVALALLGVPGAGDVDGEDGVGVDFDAVTPARRDGLGDVLAAPPGYAVTGELDDDAVVAVVVAHVQRHRQRS